MVGIIIVTHGQMAEGLLDAARMIIGQQEQCAAVMLGEGDAVDALQEKVLASVEEVDTGEGALILVDMVGASPFNVSARLAMEREKTEVITGVNLPIVLELGVQRETQTFDELVQIAKETGVDSIKILSESLAGND